MIYRRLQIGRDGHLDQSDAFDMYGHENTGHVLTVTSSGKCVNFLNLFAMLSNLVNRPIL